MSSSSANTLELKETVEAAVPSSSHSIHHDNPLPPPQQTLNVENEQHKTPPVSDDSWVVSKESLNQAYQDGLATTRSKNKCYKVPHSLRNRNYRSYMPQIVSIGPYHHRMKRLGSMNMHKRLFLHYFLKRTEHDDVEIYLNALKEVEDRIRECYEGPIDLKSDEFVGMMLLDGCFILELFQGAAEGFKNLKYQPSFLMLGSIHTLLRDLIMLENQLPLFVLDRLLGIQRGEPELKGAVSELALKFFDTLTPTESSNVTYATKFDPSSDQGREPELKGAVSKLALTFFDKLTPTESSNVTYATKFDPSSYQGSLHCLEVFRRGLLRSGPPQRLEPRLWSNSVRDKEWQLQLIHCVTELREAGVKFKRRSTDLFWDVEFKNGVLEIPRLLIHDGTKSLFLNLIAFEQCHFDYSSDFIITAYVKFMDNLINSAADVRYLRYCGIIEHGLGSDAEVADMVNCLCQEIVFETSGSYLSTLSVEVNKYFNHRWNSWRASLKHDYFSNPWAITSLFAAVILLLLTLAQTFYTVYGYYRARGN